MLSICPILRAAPLTLHSVFTILSALASDRKGESKRAPISESERDQKKLDSHIPNDSFRNKAMGTTYYLSVFLQKTVLPPQQWLQCLDQPLILKKKQHNYYE